MRRIASASRPKLFLRRIFRAAPRPTVRRCRPQGWSWSRSFQRVNDYCGGEGSAAAEGLLARAGCTPGRSRHNAAMSQGTGRRLAGGLVNNSAAHNAPTPNSAELTSNTWANPVALAAPPLIRPMDPIDISAASRETALLIADARPLCSVGTEASMTDIRGVMVATNRWLAR